jgi:hypothetical protein
MFRLVEDADGYLGYLPCSFVAKGTLSGLPTVFTSLMRAPPLQHIIAACLRSMAEEIGVFYGTYAFGRRSQIEIFPPPHIGDLPYPSTIAVLCHAAEATNIKDHGIDIYKHKIGSSQYAIRQCNINTR